MISTHGAVIQLYIMTLKNNEFYFMLTLGFD